MSRSLVPKSIPIDNLFRSKANFLSSIPLRLRYNVALIYLQQAQYNLDVAVEAYRADEKWERDHPIESSSKGKVKQKASKRKYGIGTGFTGQL